MERRRKLPWKGGEEVLELRFRRYVSEMSSCAKFQSMDRSK